MRDAAAPSGPSVSPSVGDSEEQAELGLIVDLDLNEDTQQLIMNALESVGGSIVSDAAMLVLQNAACVLATNPHLALVSTVELANMCAAIGRSKDAHDAASPTARIYIVHEG